MTSSTLQMVHCQERGVVLLPQRLPPHDYDAIALQPGMAQELSLLVPRYTNMQLRLVMPPTQQDVSRECLHQAGPNGRKVPAHDSNRPNDSLGLVCLILLDRWGTLVRRSG